MHIGSFVNCNLWTNIFLGDAGDDDEIKINYLEESAEKSEFLREICAMPNAGHHVMVLQPGMFTFTLKLETVNFGICVVAKQSIKTKYNKLGIYMMPTWPFQAALGAERCVTWEAQQTAHHNGAHALLPHTVNSKAE
jgi:hypothetical protein